MIIIDTNVWSEALRTEPNPTVLNWLRNHAVEATLTAVSVFEMRLGASLLAQGSRRTDLEIQIERLCSEMSSRTLSYDSTSTIEHAKFAAAARVGGRALSCEDGQILGIAAAHGCKIATQNVRDFEGFGIHIVDPWRG
ncbi:PIN domain-containing protein [Leucobacter coleopterorum]|nr:PIN domain-containing protein [Leucobacter coleopterorum]